MSRESQRTGKESASASAKPPTTVESTLGTYQTTTPSTTSPARIRVVRVRLEIGIGVGSAVTSGSDDASRSPPGRLRPRTQPARRFNIRFTSHSPYQAPGARPSRPTTNARGGTPTFLAAGSNARMFSDVPSRSIHPLVAQALRMLL